MSFKRPDITISAHLYYPNRVTEFVHVTRVQIRLGKRNSVLQAEELESAI